MEFAFPPEQEELRTRVRDLCSRFPDIYWRETDQARAYPEEFVQTLTKAGYLSALIPGEYGGLGLGVTEASIVLEAINHSGGSSAACHAQMYIMGALERKFRETRLYQVAPVNNNLVLAYVATHVLDLPKSY